MKPIVQLLRIKEWIKNLFLFIPAFFAGAVTHTPVLFKLCWGALAFSLVASAIYIFNDYNDREHDQLHPKKKLRPIAAGLIKPSQALMIMGVVAVLGLGLAFWVNSTFFIVLGSYGVLNIAYSLRLKHVPILDITIVASGFLLRVYGGGVLAEVPISKWLILMTFLLSILIALSKRRDDLLLLDETGQSMRPSLKGYNLQFVDTSIIVMVSITVVSYIMYTVSDEVVKRIGNDKVYLTTIFVILGLLRYLQLTYVYKRSGSPTRLLLSDIFLQLIILCWIIAFLILLYGLPT